MRASAAVRRGPGGAPSQRQAGELEGSSHDSATSAGTTCTSLASTRPIGTSRMRLGASFAPSHAGGSRQQAPTDLHTSADGQTRCTQTVTVRQRETQTQTPRKQIPLRRPIRSLTDTHIHIHTHTPVHAHVHELGHPHSFAKHPAQRECMCVLRRPSDRSGFSPLPLSSLWSYAPTYIPYIQHIQPLSPIVTLPFDIISSACDRL